MIVAFSLKGTNPWEKRPYIAFSTNLQVWYALGYPGLKERHFELRRLYKSQRRIIQYMQKTGIQLIEQAFEQVTNE